jgi:hypothetical protein
VVETPFWTCLAGFSWLFSLILVGLAVDMSLRIPFGGRPRGNVLLLEREVGLPVAFGRLDDLNPLLRLEVISLSIVVRDFLLLDEAFFLLALVCAPLLPTRMSRNRLRGGCIVVNVFPVKADTSRRQVMTKWVFALVIAT